MKTLDLLCNDDILRKTPDKESIEVSLQTRLNQVNVLLTIARYDKTGAL